MIISFISLIPLGIKVRTAYDVDVLFMAPSFLFAG